MAGKQLFSALQNRDFKYFLGVRFFSTFGAQMVSTLMAWQVYAITKDPLALGLIGLFEVLPFMASTLFGGHFADRISRKKIILVSQLLLLSCFVSLYFLSHYELVGGIKKIVWPIYLINAITGVARAFLFPANSALRANIIKGDDIQNSIAWNVNTWYFAAITGPALAGILYDPLGVSNCYLLACLIYVIAIICVILIREKGIVVNQIKENLFASLSSGIKFVFSNKVVFGAISLDLFAVLFGGVVAVLPVFAAEILHINATGLGILRAAPFAGSLISGLIIASKPLKGKVGITLLTSVLLFGLTNFLFGISTNFIFSVAMMALSGSADNVSVFIRHTIMQMYVPDDMRGRVSAVEGIFISSSNELGSFESGFAAKIMGLVPSVIFGAIMTSLSVVVTYRYIPAIRKLKW